MAIRSRNIESERADLFKGVISWICMILLFCIATVGMFFLVLLLLTPSWMEHLAGILNDVAEYFLYFHDDTDTAVFFGLYAMGALALLLVLLLLTFLFRRDRKAFEDLIARSLGKIWMELKVLFLGGAVFLFIACYEQLPYLYLIEMALLLCGPVLLLYLLCLDVSHNRRFFSHNIIHSILVRVNDHKSLSTFQRRMLRRLYSCIGVIAVLMLAGVVFLIAMNDAIFCFPLLSLAFLAAVAGAIGGVILWYIVSLKQDLQDWNVLMEQITEMYGGNLNAVNHVPPASNLYDCAQQLNSIRTGIQKAVDEGVKADRTKVELITNVSHDIKTPLTSIISYVELLKRETDLPPHVQDYVNTISAKADRLSHIVQDVFEVSKAATGNISLNLEDLDIGKLLQQTFGEMEEFLEKSPITWRVDIPDTPVIVHADGQRLYRVFQNLLRNCAQYSLEGSRAYVNLIMETYFAKVTIRNTSKTEITMSGDDLTARFVRGDETRSSEGSGLGLSIAKSFTEACGGSFALHTDGDLFLVTVQFPLAENQQGFVPGPGTVSDLDATQPICYS